MLSEEELKDLYTEGETIESAKTSIEEVLRLIDSYGGKG